MSEENKDEKYKLEFLYKAFDDTSNTIRFADTKAGFVIAFWTLVLNALIRTKGDVQKFWVNIGDKSEQILLLLFIVVMIIFCLRSVWLSYLTLVPRISPKTQINTEGFDVQGLFFQTKNAFKIDGNYLYGNTENIVVKESAKSFHERISKLDNESIEKELVFELQKITLIRTLKTDRVGSAISFVIYFLMTTALLLAYFFGPKLLNLFEIDHIFHNIEFSFKLFVIFFIGHLIVNSLFKIVKQEVIKTYSMKATIIRSSIYTAVLLAMGFLFMGHFSWVAAIIIFICRIIIDRVRFPNKLIQYVRKWINTENESVMLVLTELDKALYFIVLFLVSCLP